MRILMIHNAYARPSGEEQAVVTQARLLRGHGHEVLELTRSSASLRPGLAGKAGAFFSGIYNFSTRREMDGLLSRQQVDVVQVQNVYPQISPSVLQPCTRRGIPVVMRCPNYRLFCPIGLHYSQGQVCERCRAGREWHCIARNCAGGFFKSAGYATRHAVARRWGLFRNHVDLFIVLSMFQKYKFIANGVPDSRLAVVPNCADPADEPPNATASPGTFVSFVGRPSPEKGLDVFIDAARRLPDVPFAVAAEPAQIERPGLALPPNLWLAGFLTGPRLHDFYAQTRILVHSGKWFEGFPNVVTRAMAYGKPVIATRMGAMPEIVTDQVTGLLVDPGDAAQLANAIHGLYWDPRRCLEMGAAGLLRTRQDFSPAIVYDQLMAAYARARELKPRRQATQAGLEKEI